MTATPEPPLRIAVASGKGGTGKTTVAVSLALALRQLGPVQLVDCDVEAPNDHLFLAPKISQRRPVELLVPRVDEDRCNRCGVCARACRFGALAVVGGSVLLNRGLCHGCGLCAMVCPQRAITEVPRTIGWVERGEAKRLAFSHGLLDVGEPMATPIIEELKAWSLTNRRTIMDAPPGTGCPVIAALKGADFALLVAEPTPFGFHDLRAAVELTRTLGLPTGVVISRHGVGDSTVEDYCQREGIPVLLRIPMDRRMASSYAGGVPLVEAFPEWNEKLIQLYRTVTEQVAVAR